MLTDSPTNLIIARSR